MGYDHYFQFVAEVTDNEWDEFCSWLENLEFNIEISKEFVKLKSTEYEEPLVIDRTSYEFDHCRVKYGSVYDKCVMEVLSLAKYILRDKIEISSDGDEMVVRDGEIFSNISLMKFGIDAKLKDIYGDRCINEKLYCKHCSKRI